MNKNEKVNIIKIRIDHQVKSFKELFDGCECINSIIFKKFYRINITDMNGMFSHCSSSKDLNFFNYNTDNVTNICGMFHDVNHWKN